MATYPTPVPAWSKDQKPRARYLEETRKRKSVLEEALATGTDPKVEQKPEAPVGPSTTETPVAPVAAPKAKPTPTVDLGAAQSRARVQATLTKERAAELEQYRGQVRKGIGEKGLQNLLETAFSDPGNKAVAGLMGRHEAIKSLVGIEAGLRTGKEYATIEDFQKNYKKDWEAIQKIQEESPEELKKEALGRVVGEAQGQLRDKTFTVPVLDTTAPGTEAAVRKFSGAFMGTGPQATLSGVHALQETGADKMVQAVREMPEESKQAARMESRTVEAFARGGAAKREDVFVFLDRLADGRIGIDRDRYRDIFRTYHFDILRKKTGKGNFQLPREDWERINKEAVRLAERDVQKVLQTGYGSLLVDTDPGGAKKSLSKLPQWMRPFAGTLIAPEQHLVEGVGPVEINRGRGWMSLLEGAAGQMFGSWLTMPDDPNVPWYESWGSDAAMDRQLQYNAEADLPIRIGKWGADKVGELLGSENLADSGALQRAIGITASIPILFMDWSPIDYALFGTSRVARIAAKGARTTLGGAKLATSAATATEIASKALDDILEAERKSGQVLTTTRVSGILNDLKKVAPDAAQIAELEFVNAISKSAQDKGIAWKNDTTVASIAAAEQFRQRGPQFAQLVLDRQDELNNLITKGQAELAALYQKHRDIVKKAADQGQIDLTKLKADHILKEDKAKAKYEKIVTTAIHKQQMALENSLVQLIKQENSAEIAARILQAAQEEAIYQARGVRVGAKMGKMDKSTQGIVEALGKTWAMRVREADRIENALVQALVTATGRKITKEAEGAGRVFGDWVAKPKAKILRQDSPEFWQLLGRRKPTDGRLASATGGLNKNLDRIRTRAHLAKFDGVMLTEPGLDPIILKPEMFLKKGVRQTVPPIPPPPVRGAGKTPPPPGKTPPPPGKTPPPPGKTPPPPGKTPPDWRTVPPTRVATVQEVDAYVQEQYLRQLRGEPPLDDAVTQQFVANNASQINDAWARLHAAQEGPPNPNLVPKNLGPGTQQQPKGYYSDPTNRAAVGKVEKGPDYDWSHNITNGYLGGRGKSEASKLIDGQRAIDVMAFLEQSPAVEKLAGYKEISGRLKQVLPPDLRIYSFNAGDWTNDDWIQKAKALGLYWTDWTEHPGYIYLRGDVSLSGLSHRTILHECIHAATTRQLLWGEEYLRRGINNPLSEAWSELDNLWKLVRKNVRNPAKPNWVANPHELLSEGLSDPYFQKILQDIKLGGGQTAFTKFTELVRKALGIGVKEKTALSELIRLADETMRLEVPTKAKLQADRVWFQPTGKMSVAQETATGVRGPPGTGQQSVEAFADTLEQLRDGDLVAQYLSKRMDLGVGPRAEAQRQIMRRIAGFVEGVEVRVVRPGEASPLGPISRGNYTARPLHDKTPGSKDTIYLSHPTHGPNGIRAETVAHELIHAATSRRIADGKMFANKDTDLHRATKDLIILSKRLIIAYKKDPQAYTRVGNEFHSASEILAWGLTNQKFQDWLMSVKVPGVGPKGREQRKLQSGWSVFVDTIRNILGLSPKDHNALSELLRISDDLLEADVQDLPLRRYVPLSSDMASVPSPSNALLQATMSLDPTKIVNLARGKIGDLATNATKKGAIDAGDAGNIANLVVRLDYLNKKISVPIDELLGATGQMRLAEGKKQSKKTEAAAKAAASKAETAGLKRAIAVEDAGITLNQLRSDQRKALIKKVAALQAQRKALLTKGTQEVGTAVSKQYKKRTSAQDALDQATAQKELALEMAQTLKEVLDRQAVSYRLAAEGLQQGMRSGSAELAKHAGSMGAMLPRMWEERGFKYSGWTARDWLATAHQYLGQLGQALDPARQVLGGTFPVHVREAAKAMMFRQDWSTGAIGRLHQKNQGNVQGYTEDLKRLLAGEEVNVGGGGTFRRTERNIYAHMAGSEKPFAAALRYIRGDAENIIGQPAGGGKPVQGGQVPTQMNKAFEGILDAALPPGRTGDLRQAVAVRQSLRQELAQFLGVGVDNPPDVTLDDLYTWLKDKHAAIYPSESEDVGRAWTLLARSIFHGAHVDELLQEVRKLQGPSFTPEQAEQINWFLKAGDVPNPKAVTPFESTELWDNLLKWGLHPARDRITTQLQNTQPIGQALVRVSEDPLLANHLPSGLVNAINSSAEKILKEPFRTPQDRSFANVPMERVRELLWHYASMWRTSAVAGYLVIKPGRMVSVFAGDALQLWTEVGPLRSTLLSVQSGIGYVPGFGEVAQKWMAKTARQSGRPTHGPLTSALFHPYLDKILEQSDDVFDLNGVQTTGAKVYRELVEDQVFDTILTGDLLQAMRRAPYGKVSTFLAGTGRAYRQYLDTLRDYYTYAVGRQRAVTYLDARSRGLTREEARNLMLAAHYDWKFTGTHWEMGIINSVVPFYSYFRNAIKQFGRSVAEPFTLTTPELAKRSLAGRLKFQRSRQQILLAKAMPDWYFWDDPEEVIDQEERRAMGAKNIFAWWAGAQPVGGVSELSPELQEAYKRRYGREVTHEMLMYPLVTALDMFYLSGLTTQLAYGQMLALMGDKTALEDGAVGRVIDEYTDLFGPVSGAVLKAGTDHVFSGDYVPINETQHAFLQNIPLSHTYLRWDEGDRPRAASWVKHMLESVPILSTEILPIWRAVDNPAWEVSRKEGARRMIQNLTRLAKPVAYNPEQQLQYEQTRRLQKLRDRERDLKRRAYEEP